MKKNLFVLFIFCAFEAKAQKIENIFVNLYTDSLKKGTHNYINIDGQLSNGKYLPLDSTQILFTCSQANFAGNSIIIPLGFTDEKVLIKATLKTNALIFKEFEVYVKKMEDPPLKSSAEIISEVKKKAKNVKPKSKNKF